MHSNSSCTVLLCNYGHSIWMSRLALVAPSSCWQSDHADLRFEFSELANFPLKFFELQQVMISLCVLIVGWDRICVSCRGGAFLFRSCNSLVAMLVNYDRSLCHFVHDSCGFFQGDGTDFYKILGGFTLRLYGCSGPT